MLLIRVALEVQLQIFQLCSPNDLAVVSRVHSSLRDVAEYLLYSLIDFSSLDSDGGTYNYLSPWESAVKKTAPLLSTLASNTWKASTITAFYIQLDGDDDNRDVPCLLLVELAGVLEKMPNLVDLRILIYEEVDRSDGIISKVIGGGYFKLRTLYLGFFHDIEGVIAGQPQLLFLGLYNSRVDTQLVREKVTRLYQNNHCHCHHASSGPAILIVDFGLKWTDTEITIFPVFHRSVDAPQVFRHISVQPKIHDGYYGSNSYAVSLSLFGISEDSIDSFCETLEAMAVCARHHLYPDRTAGSYTTLRIIVHETTIQKPWLSPEFIRSLAQVESVKHLSLYFPKHAELHPLSADLRQCLLKGLGHREWARLRTITLQCLTKQVTLNRRANWVPTADW